MRSEERVIAVYGSTVVTSRESVVTTYLDAQGAFLVGDVLDKPPPHRARREEWRWSPFDEPGADDEPSSARRVF